MRIPHIIAAAIIFVFLAIGPVAFADVVADWSATLASAQKVSAQTASGQTRASDIVQAALVATVTGLAGTKSPDRAAEDVPSGVNLDAAASQAAYTTLASLYPAQRAAFDSQLANSLTGLTGSQQSIAAGRAWGEHVAQVILAERDTDVLLNSFTFSSSEISDSSSTAPDGHFAATSLYNYSFSTLAGTAGSADGTGSAAGFANPIGVAADSNGNVYVVDSGNSSIRKVSAEGVVTTLPGTFEYVSGVAVDSMGNVYVTETDSGDVAGGINRISKITPAGIITPLAGSYQGGHADGTGTAAQFLWPFGPAVDSSGNVFVADSENHTIRKITAGGVVTTLAGAPGSKGSADGTGSAARFSYPLGVAVDSSGNVFVADTYNHTIRKITADGVVTTLAGASGSEGSADGTGSAARFSWPYGVAADSSGNVYVADEGNGTIRKITAAGVVTTFAGTPGSKGSADGTGSAARFSWPAGVAVDSSGNVYVADEGNGTIRKITAGGVVTTLAGTAGSADGTGSTARFSWPYGVAADSSGNVYVADSENHTIRKITAGGVVTTLAGAPGSKGSADGTGSAARFSYPLGVAVDSSGNVFVADTYNHTIRKITADGVVTTLAGASGSEGSADGTGSAARFSNPRGVAVDSSGNVFVTDSENNTIRKITAGGVVTTLAGTPGSRGSADGSGSTARFSWPYGVAADSSGNVYVADEGNGTIRKITAAGVVTTFAGTPGSKGSADGTGSAAQFTYPSGVAADSSGNVYVADSENNTIRKITAAGVVTTLAGMRYAKGSADGTGSAARFSWPSGVAVDSNDNLYVADTGNRTIRIGVLVPVGLAITKQPQSQSVLVGENATFMVEATGLPAPTYQWFRNAIALIDATSPILTLGHVQLSDHNSVYTVKVSNSSGSETSIPAALTVIAPVATPPATTGNSTGGGGAPSGWFLGTLLLLFAARARHRPASIGQQ